MNKILSGFIGLFVVTVLVAGVAYALFSTSASVNGVVLGTSTPGLELCDQVGGAAANCTASFDFPTANPFGPLVPGGEDWADFFLYNNSSAPTTGGNALALNLFGTISAAGGDWGSLADAVQMKICLYDTTPGTNHCDTTHATTWKNLSEWNASDIALPGSPLAQGDTVRLTILFRLPSSFDNAVAAKTITDMNITFKGVQAL